MWVGNPTAVWSATLLLLVNMLASSHQLVPTYQPCLGRSPHIAWRGGNASLFFLFWLDRLEVVSDSESERLNGLPQLIGVHLSCFCRTVVTDYYRLGCQRLILELLSPMVVMLEGLGFNLCVVPFLNICVLNLPQGQGQSVLEVVGVGSDVPY